MTTSLVIEEETGTYRGRREHRHNGYYAGDFSDQPFFPLQPRTALPTSSPRFTTATLVLQPA